MKRNALKILVASVAATMIMIGLWSEETPSKPPIEKKFGHDNPITRHGPLVWGPHGVVHDMAYYEVTGKAYRAGLAMR